MIWIGFAVVVAALLAYLILPLLREGHSDGADPLHIYREAMDAAQSDEERAEIEARILAAAAASGPAARPLSAQAVSVIIVTVTLALLGGGLGLYNFVGKPDLEGRPIASITRPAGGPVQGVAEDTAGLGELAEQLRDKLMSQGPQAPAEGWVLLARTYLQLGRYADGADAFEQAASRTPSDPEPLMAAGEALVFAAGGRVPDRAYGLFSDALLLDPGHAGSRYYVALYEFQTGRITSAYDKFVALYNDSPDGASWMGQLVARLEEVATASGRPLPEKLVARVAELRAAQDSAPAQNGQSAQPAPTQTAPTQTTQPQSAPGPSREDMDAAAQMSADDRMDMIRGMVAGLAERLAEEPDDLDGWTRLARAYKVLGEVENHADAAGNIARLSPDDTAAQTAYGEALINATGNDQVPDAAMAAFDRALLLAPTNLQARYYRGLGHASRGDKAAARADLQLVLDALPQGTPVREGVAAALKDLQD